MGNFRISSFHGKSVVQNGKWESKAQTGIANPVYEILFSKICIRIHSIKFRCASLFAVDTSCYFGPRILNSQIKRHILTRNFVLFNNISKCEKANSQIKKTADNEVHLYLTNGH